LLLASVGYASEPVCLMGRASGIGCLDGKYDI
jgi:hypothetical protein